MRTKFVVGTKQTADESSPLPRFLVELSLQPVVVVVNTSRDDQAGNHKLGREYGGYKTANSADYWSS